MFFFVLLIIFLNIIFPLKSNAHHGCEGVSGVGIAGPIITIPAYTLPKGLKYINLLNDYTNYNEFSNNKLIELDKRGEHVHSTAHLYIPSLGFGYGITDDLTLGFRVPYVFRYGLKDIHYAEVGKSGDSIGVGDVTLFSQYRFYKKQNLNIALLTGLKIPSGVRRVKGRDATHSVSEPRQRRDEIFEADEQPGSGSWDPLLGVAISRKIRNTSLDINGLYKFTTNGSQGSNLGDIVNYNLALSHRFFKWSKWSDSIYGDGILELNGSWSQKPNTYHGFIDENHGGNIVYISPGVRFTYDKKWVWYASGGFPVIENLNGRAKAPSFRLISGITRIF